jgi:uncharacterized protein YkuJ
MNIGILTYNKFHKKSYEILVALKSKKYKKIVLIYLKVKKFEKRNFYLEHRPNKFKGVSVFEIAKKFNLKAISVKNKKCFDNLDIVLICGS